MTKNLCKLLIEPDSDHFGKIVPKLPPNLSTSNIVYKPILHLVTYFKFFFLNWGKGRSSCIYMLATQTSYKAQDILFLLLVTYDAELCVFYCQ